MRGITVAMACLVLLIMSGCVASFDRGRVTGSEAWTITVVDSDERQGHCGSEYPVGTEKCVTVQLQVGNDDPERDLTLDVFDWSALDPDGGVHGHSTWSSPDAVAPGGEVQATVGFEVPAGVELVTLRWTHFWTDKTGSAAI